MIRATIFRDENRQIRAFSVKGHAGYAPAGEDIICAAVSVLTINTINSIEKLTTDRFESQIEEASGDVSFVLTDTAGRESELLLESFVIGLDGIEQSYGSKYIHLEVQSY